MPYPNGTYINQILDPNVKNELDQFYSLLQGYLSNQHHDDGSHGAVTADSLAVNGATTVAGPVTATGPITALSATGSYESLGATSAGGNLPGLYLVKGPNTTDPAWRLFPDNDSSNPSLTLEELNVGPDLVFTIVHTGVGTYTIRPYSSGATVALGEAATGRRFTDCILSGSVYEASRTVGMGYWQNFSPTLANITVGNGTVVARYALVGKTVHVYVSFTLGSTSAIGTGPQVSLPVTANSNVVDVAIGNGEAIHTGVAGYSIVSRAGSTTGLLPLVQNLTGGYVSEAQITATVPFTWVTGDMLNLSFTYEMA